MNLDEAIAVYLYLDNNTEAWAEPAKSAKAEAWSVIRHYAREAIKRHADVKTEQK